MIQLIQVAGGDVYAVNREDATLERWTRTSWQNPYKLESEASLLGFLDAKVGDPLRFHTAVGWRQAPLVQRMAWMLAGGEIEESLYATEWIEGFEAFFHRGIHANNPHPHGTLSNNFWAKGYDHAQSTRP